MSRSSPFHIMLIVQGKGRKALRLKRLRLRCDYGRLFSQKSKPGRLHRVKPIFIGSNGTRRFSFGIRRIRRISTHSVDGLVHLQCLGHLFSTVFLFSHVSAAYESSLKTSMKYLYSSCLFSLGVFRVFLGVIRPIHAKTIERTEMLERGQRSIRRFN